MAKSRKFKKEDPIVASQIWAVLVWAAKNRQILTYKHLTPLVNKNWLGDDMSLPLGLIKQYCQEKDLPALTVLVVDATTGTPNKGLANVRKPRTETMKVYNFADEQWRIFWDSKKWSKCGSTIINPGFMEFWRLIPEDQRPEMKF